MIPTDPALRILHLVLVLRSTNSQYNEHSLPVMDQREISLCTYFKPQLKPPDQIRVFAGDDTLRGFFRTLRRALRSDKHDVIHAHSPQTGVFLILAMMMRLDSNLRRRSVYTVHDSYYDYKLRNRIMMVPSLALFRRVVFCSNAAYESLPTLLHRLAGRRARVVQNGVDIERVDRVLESFDRGSETGFTVLSIGRLERVKDPVAVVEAFELLGEADAKLILIGDGELRPQVEEAIARSSVGDDVTLTGLIEREEVFRHLMRADAFISMSHGEGLPVAAMEAMACSVPVILSDIPPHREFKAEPDLIPLIAVGDVDGFARAIGRLRSMSPDERSAIGRASRDLVASSFSLDRMNDGYASIYLEMRAVPAESGR